MKKLLLILALFVSFSVYATDILRDNPFHKNYTYLQFKSDITHFKPFGDVPVSKTYYNVSTGIIGVGFIGMITWQGYRDTGGNGQFMNGVYVIDALALGITTFLIVRSARNDN